MDAGRDSRGVTGRPGVHRRRANEKGFFGAERGREPSSKEERGRRARVVRAIARPSGAGQVGWFYRGVGDVVIIARAGMRCEGPAGGRGPGYMRGDEVSGRPWRAATASWTGKKDDFAQNARERRAARSAKRPGYTILQLLMYKKGSRERERRESQSAPTSTSNMRGESAGGGAGKRAGGLPSSSSSSSSPLLLLLLKTPPRAARARAAPRTRRSPCPRSSAAAPAAPRPRPRP